MRPSQVLDEGRPLNNLPGLYPTEDWVVHYWDVAPLGELTSRRATIQLPLGYASVCPAVSIGQAGCVHRVRRWGVQLYTSILQDIGFDPTRLVHLRPAAPSRAEDAQLITVLLQATHFDLPSHFVIASEEHPLLLFDPEGLLKGSYTHWHTHLGAAAYLLTDGKVNGTFGRVHSDSRMLYDQALGYVLEALSHRESS